MSLPRATRTLPPRAPMLPNVPSSWLEGRNASRIVACAAIALACLSSPAAKAQTCTTQSQMQAADRTSLAAAASRFAAEVQKNDAASIKAQTIPEFTSDFSGIAESVAATAPRVATGRPVVEQVYVLDASSKTGASDTQFFCSLNRSAAEADFSIPQLPAGRYAFAMVRVEGASPYRLSLLMRQAQDRWLLAGFYPKALTAGGHDGLWYWTEARRLAAAKQNWPAWLYLQEAQSLLQPAPFVNSSHLTKLVDELGTTAPPVVSNGVTAAQPLIVKGADGQEFRFTSLSVDDSLGGDKVDVAAHLSVASLGDTAAARQRNLQAMAALIAAHPELRGAFHGVWIFADAPQLAPYATEEAMAAIHP